MHNITNEKWNVNEGTALITSSTNDNDDDHDDNKLEEDKYRFNDDNNNNDVVIYDANNNEQQHTNYYITTNPFCSLCKNRLYTYWIWYNHILEQRPLLVKCITATFILSFADLLAQIIEYYMIITHDNNNDVQQPTMTIDWYRMIRYSIMGLFGTPWSHYYFHYLDYYLPPTAIICCSYTTLLKIIIDQFIQAPILLVIMISTLSFMKGDGIHGIKNDIHTLYVPSLIANWKLWLPASAINIAFIQPTLRVLYINIVFFLWIVILSLLLNKQQ